MKKIITTSTIIIFTIVAFLIAFSCKKKNDPAPSDPITPAGNTTNIDGFFTSNATPANSYTINTAMIQTITGTRAIISIPANAFVTKSTGSPVSGTVQITVKEIYSKKDMILNKAQTMTATDLLSSAGELDIKAYQGSVALKLAPSKQLSIKIKEPAAPQSGMALFYGNTNANQQLVWNLSTATPSINPTADSTSLGGGYYYNFNCDSLGWINCDMFYSANPKTHFTVTVNGSHDKSNTQLFIAFPAINGVSHMYCGTTNLQLFSHYAQVPVGINATIIAISEINGQYYSAFVPATITNNFSTAITLTATTNAQILTQLNAL